MARYKQSEFAVKCGVNNPYISVNIKRGKITLDADGYINDLLPENADFLKKKQAEMLAKVGVTAVGSSKQASSKTKTQPTEAESTSGKSKFELDKEKRVLEIEKLKVDTRLQELKEEKIRGEVIPIALVKQIFSSFNQSIMTAQKDFLDYLLITIAKEHGLTGAQVAALTTKGTKALNLANDKANAMTKKNMVNLIEEFSIKKEVGEHE